MPILVLNHLTPRAARYGSISVCHPFPRCFYFSLKTYDMMTEVAFVLAADVGVPLWGGGLCRQYRGSIGVRNGKQRRKALYVLVF